QMRLILIGAFACLAAAAYALPAAPGQDLANKEDEQTWSSLSAKEDMATVAVEGEDEGRMLRGNNKDKNRKYNKSEKKNKKKGKKSNGKKSKKEHEKKKKSQAEKKMKNKNKQNKKKKDNGKTNKPKN
ncbi:unnamed protein product, partial [Meganyctiphanes norvegica]